MLRGWLVRHTRRVDVSDQIVEPVVEWFDEAARDLPWRRPECSPWGVLVSEFMLQQTPVSRVLEPWRRWLERWPVPAALAAEPAGEAIRAWGRLGYPRRAMRLHAAAVAITEQHDGQVPSDHRQLLELPGVGSYTAAAIASFAFGQRQVVLDTNVRRVLGRLLDGTALPGPTPTRGEYARAEALLPDEPALAARWAAASMELGALVCTAKRPECSRCPVIEICAWHAAGTPDNAVPRRGQGYAGTDRQCRGAILRVLRESEEPVSAAQIDLAWPEPVQRERALQSLIADGLVVATSLEYRLP
ncbi:A/G-specific adenine glycosylase [Naumannella halotolerans]|uniref:Adenine DNA glycosylase n=1 Tax=Naumannella halotolerans TaxID=993414 RepID=A0A4R7J0W6_9ACTN|nr:A/G-specific adenine glycosylase [Naumannella halotolerans]